MPQPPMRRSRLRWSSAVGNTLCTSSSALALLCCCCCRGNLVMAPKVYNFYSGIWYGMICEKKCGLRCRLTSWVLNSLLSSSSFPKRSTTDTVTGLDVRAGWFAVLRAAPAPACLIGRRRPAVHAVYGASILKVAADQFIMNNWRS